MISTQAPRLVRNANLLGRAICWGVVAVSWAIVTVVSRFSLGWWTLVLLASAILWAAYCMAGWWSTRMTIDDHTVAITDRDGSIVVAWNDIEGFEIRPPERRTLLMLMFGWRRDQARLRLQDGSVIPVPAIQPWHGAGHSGVSHETKADRLVESLNRLVEQRGSRG